MPRFLKKIDNQLFAFPIFLLLYGIVTYSILNRYNLNPTAMINFGMEFALQNKDDMPGNAIVQLGSKDDLGAGYDGQIFYFYSRTISKISTNWPKGFDESYRAPRIGYPLLIALFGFISKNFAVYGMYILNIGLFYLSYLALRSLLSDENKYLALFYLFSPFSLGSYSVLVSDSVMASLVIFAYYFYMREKYLLFIISASLAILTKEPSLFLFFPLGIKTLTERNFKKAIIIASILVIPVLWHAYLRYTFPNWKATRLADFIQPLEGILAYFKVLIDSVNSSGNIKDTARILSRLPLFILLIIGIIAIFHGNIRKGYIFRLGLAFTFFMISAASYYHFWSVYENVSRMFTISIPMIILLKEEDESASITIAYLALSFFILILFLLKVIYIQKAQDYTLWGL